MKSDGGLFAKVQKILPEMINIWTWEMSIYRYVSKYSLAWVVKTCEKYGGHSCIYHETVVTMGNLRDGILTELSAPFQARTDYTEEDILFKREAYTKAKNLADEARNQLYPFGEYDN